MRVKLLNIYASPKGTFGPGTIIDLDSHEANQLLAGRYAEPVGLAAKAVSAVAAKASAPEKAVVTQPETRTASAKAAPKPPAKKPAAAKKPKVEPPKPA